ncbi:MAG TPA: PepSY domain-containing protein, partial [Archangium sp.]
RSWASGSVSFATIAYENQPNPVSNMTATLSAGGRCYGLWMQRGGNPLTFANAGAQTQVWLSSTPGYYQYQCLICSDAKAPGKVWWNIDASVAAERVRAKFGGQIVAVERKLQQDGDLLAANYEVSVAVGEHLTQVFVDGRSGEVIIPEVTTDIVVVPENVCR